ncbi:3-keto-disaccharide hydrolase [Maribacter arcticus]|uniref:3-keto-alpha-glucoside-1,2-lyase/3-keto-2-hydroxy-glucal hydratase domain-containing protein n=1 Tax=Maribacter arcticus TaxID=561365 RepID=A0A1T5C3H1_9FLAO|nr:DUF1080 domain-containing protein [Maribacter arcticus]SKB53926.1 protein of unknown function [Maribacter arcticus]
MTKHFKKLFFYSFLIVSQCILSQESTKDWETLFNGFDLKNWDTYLGPQFIEGVPMEKIDEQIPYGLNNDPIGVFTIADVDGEKVLRISGECWGGISTKREFENYHLQLQFKWGDKKWYPREKLSDKRDSGLLYHAVGDHADGDKFWLRSQEFQIQEGDCGDYWGVAGALLDIRATKTGNDDYRYDEKGNLLTFSSESENGRHCIKYPDGENQTGKWNTVDLYCFGGKSVHIINGKVVMVLENSRQLVDGKESPLTKGKIQLQSESAEIFYKDIKIRSIKSLPRFE